VIVGNEVFAGRVGTGTTAVCADVALEEPALFEAVTTTRIVEPPSAVTSVYVLPAAPAMSAQLAPAELQRRHW
jgi:hypothetical protein